MTSDKTGTGSSAPPKGGAADGRAERLAAALRDNLKRRKAQQRARDGAPGKPAPEGGRRQP